MMHRHPGKYAAHYKGKTIVKRRPIHKLSIKAKSGITYGTCFGCGGNHRLDGGLCRECRIEAGISRPNVKRKDSKLYSNSGLNECVAIKHKMFGGGTQPKMPAWNHEPEELKLEKQRKVNEAYARLIAISNRPKRRNPVSERRAANMWLDDEI